MIIDTSAIVAILAGEEDAAELAHLIESVDEPWIAAGTVLEASLVLGSRRQGLLDDFLDIANARVIAFDEEQLTLAREAHLRFGRGSGSPARLIYGDCFAYACAKVLGVALLYKGNDFADTDLA